jgi:hypothetical protein
MKPEVWKEWTGDVLSLTQQHSLSGQVALAMIGNTRSIVLPLRHEPKMVLCTVALLVLSFRVGVRCGWRYRTFNFSVTVEQVTTKLPVLEPSGMGLIVVVTVTVITVMVDLVEIEMNQKLMRKKAVAEVWGAVVERDTWI